MGSVASPARAFVAKSPDNIVEANITLTGGADPNRSYYPVSWAGGRRKRRA